jgi:hypothetical protein
MSKYVLREPSYAPKHRNICITPINAKTRLSDDLGRSHCKSIFENIMRCNCHFLFALHHLMLETPPSTLAYLCDDSIAISKKIDIEVDVMDGLV